MPDDSNAPSPLVIEIAPPVELADPPAAMVTAPPSPDVDPSPVPAPAVTNTAPPAPEASVLSPAVSVILPPAPVLPVPIKTEMSPPAPPTASPELTATDPEAPLVASPVLTDIAPLTPEVPASADAIVTVPDDSVSPVPLTIHIDPPVEFAEDPAVIFTAPPSPDVDPSPAAGPAVNLTAPPLPSGSVVLPAAMFTLPPSPTSVGPISRLMSPPVPPETKLPCTVRSPYTSAMTGFAPSRPTLKYVA